MDIKTKCIHGELKKKNSFGSICTPIYQSATFEHIEVGVSSGYDYSRLQNPTRDILEQRINDLEDGFDTVAFSSGMAAGSVLMEIFSPGDHIIATDDLYGGMIRLFGNVSKKNGIEISFADTTNVFEIEKNLRPNTKAIFVEAITNPMMKVTDILEISKFAKKRNLLFIVDNTFLTPYYFKPIKFGADIVVHSGTKFLSGHNDTLAGFLTVSSEALSEKIRFIAKTIGAALAPFDSYLLIRGVKTLAIRMERQQENAIKIANWLLTRKEIKKVHYVGLENHDGYETLKKFSKGFGSMISFEVYEEDMAIKILNSLKVISFAESLGGVESLITYPMYQTHADVPKEEREQRGINEKLLRLSVGIEDVEDLIFDLENSLN